MSRRRTAQLSHRPLRIRRSAAALLASISLAAGTLSLTAPRAHAVSGTANVVISEVYGGGGNSGALYTSDFIELSNTTSAPVDVTGWSVQYASATGTSWQVTQLTGSVPAGGFFLVQEATGTGGTTPLPSPDVTGTIPLSGTAGKVALVNSTTALTAASCGPNPLLAPTTALPACSSLGQVVDFVGFGSTASDFAGQGPAPAPSNTLSAQRTPSASTNTASNAADFVAAAPTPKGAPAGGGGPTGPDCTANPLPPACVPGPETIQDVQGDGFISPDKSLPVTNLAGVVTAKRTTGSSRGFWIQDPNPDPSRTAASSGIFVFTSTATVAVGDSVLVSGTVNDFYPLASGETVATTSSLSITEIAPTSVTTLSRNNAIPAPLVLTPTTVPDTFSPTVAGGNIESIAAVDPADSAQEFFEAHEGMLVQVNDARVVGPGNSFGEIYVTTKPDQQATPRGGTYIAGYDAVPSGRLLVTPVSGTVPPSNVGDVLSGPTTGPVDWSSFGGYDIAATQVGTYVDNHLAGTVATPQAADQLAVATYNVENLAPADPQSKYDRLGAGVVSNLKSPDIITVEEVQDNSGATDNGVVAADQTLTKLTAAIAAAGGPAYSWSEIDPVNDADGGQPGGNIRVVFLYNPDRVSFVSKPGGDSTTAVTVSTGADLTAELSVSPGRVDPTSDAWTSSRKPLAGEFVFGGSKVIVVANHLNSKGGDQNSDGRFQPPNRTSEVQRTKQATELNTFVKQVLAADPYANIVLSGDFNDYQFSGPVKTLTDDGATLIDLINTLPVNERYTYNFNGISQVLDHIFVSKSITDVQYDVVHVNSEYAAQASDHDPQVVRIRPAATPTTTTLNLLNINDFHGRIDANTVKFAGTIEQLRAGGGEANTLLLAAGDNIGASLFASASQNDQPTIDVLNALGMNASSVGNHEFDKGYDDLVNRVVGNPPNAKWAYLGANVYLKGTTTPALPEYATFTVNGITVGVIGAVTRETPSLVSPGGITQIDIGDPVDAVNRVADQLTDGDPANGEADVLIAEYHAGATEGTPEKATLEQELVPGSEFAEIVNSTSPKVAALFTGHTHKEYAWDAPIPGTPGKTRPVLQTGDYGANIGHVTLTVDRLTKQVTSYTSANVPRTTTDDATLVATYPRVAAVKTIVDATIAQAAVIGNQPVGAVTADITTAYIGTDRDNRGAESTLGNLVANALRDELSSADRGGAQIGVVNPGGLRAELFYAPDGVVTYAEANSVLPFVNNLWTLSLTGAQFKAVLEQMWQPTGAARPFLDLGLSDNVTYTIDPTAAAGSHITSITVNGAPIDPAASYRIGTFSFLGTGGDNFTAFLQATNVQDTGLVDRDAWIHYLGAHNPVSPSFARRGVVVSNLPTTAQAGSNVSLGVSQLDLTSLGSPANTTVTASIGGVGVGSFPVSAGAAAISFTVPPNLAGPQTLTVVASPSNTTVTIPITVTAKPVIRGGVLVLTPITRPGSSVVALLYGWSPNTALAVSIDGGATIATVRTNAFGIALVAVTVPSTTSAGLHRLVFTAAGGTNNSSAILVLRR